MPRKPLLRAAFRWADQFVDPRRVISGARGLLWYWRDWRRYAAMPGAERLAVMESYPQLHDRVGLTPFDAHYFYSNGWAMRRVVARRPASHVDVGSQIILANLLAAAVPVTFVDYRPLAGTMSGVQSIGASILALPFRDATVDSLSCIHVAEHIGLGRYGDPLDPAGTRKAAAELARVIRPGGELLFGLPIGRARVCFNAHRVHDPLAIRDYFAGLDMVEFSAVTDGGRYEEQASINSFSDADYACGLFRFRKPPQ